MISKRFISILPHHVNKIRSLHAFPSLLREKPTNNQNIDKRIYSRSFSNITPHEDEVKGWKKYLTPVVTVGGGAVALYGISRIMYYMATSFLALTPAGSLYYGFIGGCISSGFLGLMIGMGIESQRLDPDLALRYARSLTLKHGVVKQLLGNNLKVNELKLYKTTHGGLGVRNGVPQWVSPEVNLVFHVNGSLGEGIVRANCVRKNFNVIVTYLSFDHIDSNKGISTLLLLGQESDWKLNDATKELISSYRSKYLQ